MAPIVLICAQLGEKKKSLCKNLRKIDHLENLSWKDEGASGKLVKTVVAVFNKTKHCKNFLLLNC